MWKGETPTISKHNRGLTLGPAGGINVGCMVQQGDAVGLVALLSCVVTSPAAAEERVPFEHPRGRGNGAQERRRQEEMPQIKDQYKYTHAHAHAHTRHEDRPRTPDSLGGSLVTAFTCSASFQRSAMAGSS
jgi:hypothetical protein